uniref:Uncharacterized protein n=1 Tax=Eutreptiella gymnastica TaxID=73025 RepID=A0A7S1IS96_9EUGL|mmetsp:Transcript_38343/g.68515  ORF Transcript_38343/g.68515 Transcript_38343/m.68515 type:complete len:167 (+) Transcript_38343:517-1017(+)
MHAPLMQAVLISGSVGRCSGVVQTASARRSATLILPLTLTRTCLLPRTAKKPLVVCSDTAATYHSLLNVNACFGKRVVCKPFSNGKEIWTRVEKVAGKTSFVGTQQIDGVWAQVIDFIRPRRPKHGDSDQWCSVITGSMRPICFGHLMRTGASKPTLPPCSRPCSR